MIVSNPKIETAISESIDDYLNNLDGEAKVENMYRLIMAEAEYVLLKSALEKNSYNQTRAAKWLGITRNTLKKKMTEHGL